MKKAKIKELRKKLGITQAELSEIIGCSLPSVEHWERGYRNPGDEYGERLERLWRIANRLEKAGKYFDASMIPEIQKED